MWTWFAIVAAAFIHAIAAKLALEWWQEPAEARRARKARSAARHAALRARWAERQKQ